MPIATCSLAVALLASSPLAAAPLLAASPPMTISVSVTADLSPSLVTRVLAEAGEIWRAAGFTLVWQRAAAEVAPYVHVSESGRYMAPVLRVTVGNDRGVAADKSAMPLGWIVFDDANTPQQEIYVSHANAHALMDLSRGVVGSIEQMTRTQLDLLLGRAMGRALAHEIGHYLLASKVHSAKGLMQARLSAAALFSAARSRFAIDVQQRMAIADRLALVARRGGRTSTAGPG